MPWFKRRRKEDPDAEAELVRIGEAIAGSALAGGELTALRVPATDEVAVAVEIGGDDVRDAWPVARALLDTTGRWPVAVTSFGDRLTGDEIFVHGGAHTAALERARTLTPEDGLTILHDLHGDLSDYDGWDGLEDRDDGSHLEWYVPGSQPTAIAFVPVTTSHEALAYVGLFPYRTDEDVEELAALVAIARGWHERHGAELVAAWGTMLQFAVARPPEGDHAALALTAEHVAVAADTIVLPGVLARAHARALVGRDEWFVHSRP